MSFLRDLATGSDNCTPDGAGPSNAVGALVNTLLGSSSKTQEQLREVRAEQQPNTGINQTGQPLVMHACS